MNKTSKGWKMPERMEWVLGLCEPTDRALVAAAPEMLAALKYIAAFSALAKPGTVEEEAFQAASDAVAKAEGRYE